MEGIRGKPVKDKTRQMVWGKAIAGYIEDKLHPTRCRPKHLAGRPLRQFRPGTADKVRSCLKVFGDWTGVLFPSLVTSEKLEEYYQLYRQPRSLNEKELARLERTRVEAERVSKKKQAREPRAPKKLIYVKIKGKDVPHWRGSEAGAQAKIRQISAFLDHVGCLPGRLQYAANAKPKPRMVKVPYSLYAKWTKEAPTPELKYVLFCGFFAGLRGGEITYSRPDWFDLSLGIDKAMLRIPGDEHQTLPNGETHHWQTKNGTGRPIPVSDDGFAEFLVDFLKEPRPFYLMAKRRAKSGLYDWGTAFDSYMRQLGRPDVFPHAMRHSWMTHLCNSRRHKLPEIMIMSGDDLETIEAHYWEKDIAPGTLNKTNRGIPFTDDEDRSHEPIWKWTGEAPRAHIELYSVQDTVTNYDPFAALLDPGDNDLNSSVTIEDWEDGKLKTVRARLRVLEKMGWVAQR